MTAQDPKSDSGDGKDVTLKDRFEQLAERISISTAGPPAERIEKIDQPVLSWSNPERNTTAGALHLWTREGRPQAAMCLYPSLEIVHLEFQSLSDHPLLAQDGYKLIWQPNEAGITWKDLPNAEPPMKTPFQRLRQMRSLVRRFEAKLVPPRKTAVPLRMLERPIYRYPKSSSELIDGAVFSFVQGTDPEVLLLLEAYQSEDGEKYRYALARMSIVPTQVTFDETRIWETDWAVQRSYTPYWVYETK
ncbi:hypothetical protein LOC67_03205 [Stieleria sp. JC731]|uniref:hypothetical protein n=1 Tax=Pirellulaceae TaxID=2691357 RepID=UPI001E609489|nr:hypothetical protein [Stieleria sp. JC731]MCC9599555.1 hypothetical protein [Stieleria sp. JC731]